MTDRELMQQALYYMDDGCGKYSDDYRKLIDALRARLAQPEPEELARLEQAMIEAWKPIPQREWQGLTDEEILEEYRQSYGDDGNLTDVYFARAIEAKLKEKNNAT